VASIRRRILENLLTTVQSATGVVASGLGHPHPNLATFERPYAAVMPQSESLNPATDELEEATLTVLIRVLVDETHQEAGLQLEDVLEQVERVITADRTRAGLAENTIVTGTRWPGIDAEEPHAGADLDLSIAYNRLRKDPANS